MRPRIRLCIAAVCVVIAGCGSDSGGSDNGGSETPPPGQPTEKDRALFPIMDYVLAVKRLDADRACNSLTKDGQQRLVRNFGSTATDCEKVLKREFSSLSEGQKRELAKRMKTANVGEGKVEGGYGNGEVIYVQGTETQFVPVKVQKVGGTWKVSDPGDDTLIPE